MFALIVHFQVRSGHEGAFDALVAQTVNGIRAHETGTLLHAVHTVGQRPRCARLLHALREPRLLRRP